VLYSLTEACFFSLRFLRGFSLKLPRLSILPETPPVPVQGEMYRFQLTAEGGVPPYTWHLGPGQGGLPPGLQLEPRLGLITGMPTAAGDFEFTVIVTDSGGPQTNAMATFSVKSPEALTLDWKQPPNVLKEGISGSVVVSNLTKQTVDLTVIIVAVNQVGKAFALAEQHFSLKPQTDSPTISFGTGNVLPYGRYTIHADAVGEVASLNQIYKTRKQTADAFVIKQQ